MDFASDTSNSDWTLCGRILPRSEIVFFTQVALIYLVVITAIVSLFLGIGNTTLWIVLLTTNTGILLPGPKLKKNGSTKQILSNSTQQHSGRGEHYIGVSSTATQCNRIGGRVAGGSG